MKKFLIFMLVLAVASSASAGLQISVNGDPDPVDSEIILNPSDTIFLDIHAIGGDTGLDWLDGIGYFGLVSNTAVGTIDPGTGIPFPGPPPITPMGSVIGNGVGNIPPGYDGIFFSIGDYSSEPPYPDGVYLDEILFHCEAPGDAHILLLEIDPYTWAWEGVILDSVIVHQIPEPATILLLGLGGLTLLRQRRR